MGTRKPKPPKEIGYYRHAHTKRQVLHDPDQRVTVTYERHREPEPRPVAYRRTVYTVSLMGADRYSSGDYSRVRAIARDLSGRFAHLGDAVVTFLDDWHDIPQPIRRFDNGAERRFVNWAAA